MLVLADSVCRVIVSYNHIVLWFVHTGKGFSLYFFLLEKNVYVYESYIASGDAVLLFIHNVTYHLSGMNYM